MRVASALLASLTAPCHDAVTDVLLLVGGGARALRTRRPLFSLASHLLSFPLSSHLRLKLTASSTAYWFWCCGRWTGGGARSITTCCLLLQEGERVLLFGIYMTNSSLFSSTENLNTASSHTPWAQLSWVLWACVPRRLTPSPLW